MIILADTSDLLRVITGSGVSAIEVQGSWVDLDGTTVTPGATNTLITTATTTTIVASPSGTAKRNVKGVTIQNSSAVTCVVTVEHYDGTNAVNLISLSLLAGYTLQYNDGDGWSLLDSNGGLVNNSITGRLLRTTVLTSASANHTVGADTRSIRIRGVGGGGGGGGCTSVASAACGAGGGGAGGYIEKLVQVTGGTAYAYTCGAAGTGVSGAAGNNGGDSTFVVGATTYTAKGGSGAPIGTAATTLVSRAGGAGGVASTNGDVNGAGAPGEYGVVLIVATPIVASGAGGSGPFGGGGLGLVAVGNGNSALGFGAGGGGSATGASAARTGGNGTQGCWIVDEYS